MSQWHWGPVPFQTSLSIDTTIGICLKPRHGCKVVKSGGTIFQITFYYTSWGVWGICALRQLLVQSEAKICLTVVS